METRLQELEMMVMHHEETIERLSNELHTQQNESRLLLNKLALMEGKLRDISVSLVASELDEAPPPHY
jgi:SlyX protein